MKINKNIFICALLVLVMLCVIGAASATDDSLNENLTSEDAGDVIGIDEAGEELGDGDTTIYVDSSYDGDEQGTETNPYKTISGAVGAANGGETIFIKNGQYSESQAISIGKNLSIVGQSRENVIISSSGSGGAFTNPAENIKLDIMLKDLTFKDITCTGSFAPVRFYYADIDLNIFNCTFDNCKSKVGAIQIGTTTATLDGCEILNSEGNQGSSSSASAILFSNGGNYSMRNCVVDGAYSGKNNYAVIYFSATSGSLDLDNLTVVNCKGAHQTLVRGANNNLISIRNSKLANNNMSRFNEYQTAALLFVAKNGKLIVEQTIIANNTFADQFVRDFDVTANTTINYCNIYNNSNYTHYKDATYNLEANYWGSNELPSDVVASSWIVENNGAYAMNNGDPLDVVVPGLNDVTEEPQESSKIIYVAMDGDDSTGTGSESAPFKSIDKVIVDAGMEKTTIFVKNGQYTTSYGIEIPANVNLRIVGEEKGKVIIKGTSGSCVFKAQENGCTLMFENLTFSDVSSTSTSAGLLIGGNNTVDIVNCTFTNINAKFGAIQMASSDVINLKDCLIENVTASSSGSSAIVYLSGTGKYNMDGIVINNVGMGDVSGDYSFMRDVIYVYSSTAVITLTNSKITNAYGPMQAIIENKATMTIENVVIMDNTVGVTKANGQGVAIIYNGVRAVNLTVSQCLIVNNKFESESGAVFYEYSNANDFNVEYSAIYNNTGSTNIVSGTSSKIAADYNYWGTNDQPTGVTVNNWVIEENGEYKLNDGSELAKEIPTLKEESEQPVAGDAIYVSTTGSDENDGSEDSPVFNITKAVELAKAGSGKIIIKEGVYSQNGITIDDTITIIGEGNVVIDGSSLESGNIFVITTCNDVTIKNIKLANVNVRDGAINIEGNSKTDLLDINVLIEDCEFDNITARRGSAIYAYYTTGNLTVVNSMFTGSYASGWGGAICAAQSAYGEGLNVNIEKSTFENNRANTGGALYLQASTLTVTDSDFYKNSAIVSSGAIYLSNITATIDNCRICNNNASKEASAIGLFAGQISTNPTVLKASELTIVNSVIENNTGGAAIYAISSNVNVAYSSIVNDLNINNTVTPNYDGNEPGTVTANNNWWGANDPAATVDGKNIVIDKWLIMNVAANATDVLVGDSVKLTVDFNHVNTTSGEIEELTGGAIPKTFTVTFTSTNGTVEPASVEVAKGTSKDVIYTVADVDAVISAQTGDYVETITFAKGVEPYYGIIYVTKDGDDKNNGSEEAPVATIAKAIELASIKGGSGEIIVYEGTYNGANYTVTRNLTVTGVGEVILDAQNDGFLFKVDSDSNVDKFELINLTLTGAKAYHGAVVYNNAKELILDTVTITNNVDTGSIILNRGNLNIKNSVFTNQNSADIIKTSGGKNVVINNTRFEDNVVTADSSSFAIVYIDSGKGNIIIENSVFINNIARQGMVISSQLGASPDVYIRNSKFINNTNQVSYGTVNSYAKLEVSDSLFENNFAKRGGGAIYVGYGGVATVTKTVFINNAIESENEGSAIYNNNKLTVNYCVLLSNTSNSIIYHNGGENVANAQFNWWGTNDNPENLVEVGEYEDYYDEWADCEIDTSNWVVMNVTSDATSEMINIGDNVHVTVDFTNYVGSSGTPQKLAEALPEITFDASAVNGVLDKTKVTTVDGIAQITYTAAVGGEDTITVKSGSAVENILLNVTKPYNGEIYVSKSGSDDNNGSEAAPVATIAKAVELAQECSGRIVITEGVYAEDSIVITKDLNIAVEGAVTIDGNGKRAIQVKSGNVTISGITFTNCNETNNGAVIRVDSGRLTIDNSSFIKNGGENKQALIQVKKASLNLTNCLFKDNTASLSGNSYGTVYISDGTLNADNCNFTNNNNKYGAFYITTSNATITNCEIIGHVAAANGGSCAGVYVGGQGTYISSYSGKLIEGKSSFALIKNCKFINNTAKPGTYYAAQGGAIYVNNNATLIIEDSLFENNKALDGNSLAGQGGAIYASAGNIKVTNSIFKNNSANNGSVVYMRYYAQFLNPDEVNCINISNSIIIGEGNVIESDNTNGSYIVNGNWWGTNSPADKVTSRITLENWIVLSGNFTPGEVEAGSQITVTASLDKLQSNSGISDYTGTLPEEIEVTFTSTSGHLNVVKTTVNGKASVTYTVDAKDKQIIITSGDAKVVLRLADEVEPVIYVDANNGDDNNNGSRATPVKTLEAALLLADNGQIVLLEGVHKVGNLGSIYSDLNITGEGKVIIDAQNNNRILYVGLDAKVVLKNLIMINGYAVDGSGALLGNSNELTLINCTLANSSAGDNNGGAIYNVGKLTIINSTIANNTAKEGGAIFTNDAVAAGAGIIIENSIFENNVATGSDNFGGGAIFAQQIAELKITDSTFKDNKAQGTSSGGAIFISHSTADIIISGSEFIANHANGQESVGGGAIYMVGTSNYERKGTLTISNTLFEDNTADANGGAIYVRATTLNIANSALINNRDANGLAIYGYKTEQVSPSITANDNWWGSNSDPKDLVGGNGYKPTISSWAKLTISNDTAISQGNDVNVTVAFDKDISIARPVTVRLGSEYVTGILENGEFTTTYTVPAGLKVISASVDDETAVLYMVSTETSLEISNITAQKGDYIGYTINVTTADGTVVNMGNVEVYFADDLIATIPVTNGKAIRDLFIGKDNGIYTITVKYVENTGEFKNSTQTATLNITGESHNIVTPDTFGNFFDANGALKPDVTLDELIFKGEFRDLNIVLNKAIAITGVNALLNNTSIKITADNVKVSNIHFVADKTFDQKAVIYSEGKNTTLEGNVIDYDAPNTGDSYAIYMDSSDKSQIIENTVNYDGKLGENIKTIALYAVECNDLIVKGNNFNISIPSISIADYGMEPHYYSTLDSEGILISSCDNLLFDDNTVSVRYNNYSGWDTINGVHIKFCDDSTISNNNIELDGHTYAYAVHVDGSKNVNVTKNTIVSNSDAQQANALEFNGECSANIDNNTIVARSPNVVYPLLLNDLTAKSEFNVTNNDIRGESNTVYGIYAQVNRTDIADNNITVEGNHVYGISTHQTDVVIDGNEILANGTDIGDIVSGQSGINENTTGMIISQGSADIKNNNVITTGKSAIIVKNTKANISDNGLTANGTTADDAISIVNSDVTLSNNTEARKKSENTTPVTPDKPDVPVEPVVKITATQSKVDYGFAYKVRVTTDGVSVGAGKQVTLKIAGKTLKATTDKNGYATFKLAVKPKSYTATATYGKVSQNFKVAVKNVIRAKNLKVKKSAKVLKIKVTLKTSNKKPIKSKKLTLKIKGKKVKAKTNKKGVATFKVKKNILKKLKAGKKYKYQVIYGKDTVKKTLKVKK